MPKKAHSKRVISVSRPVVHAHAALFWACILTLVLVPLVFSTAVYRIYVLPKFALLLLGAATILVLTAVSAVRRSPADLLTALKSRHVLLVLMYMAAIAFATVVGVEPLVSLLGTSTVEMGLLTRLCFFVVFIGLIISVGRSEERLSVLLWAMALTGLGAAAYACLQFFGQDPFISPGSYTSPSSSDAVLRVPGTLGHSNYLGNFLLYSTPLSVGLGLAAHGRERRIALAGAGLSLAAITFSGTRGAWLGTIVGAMVFGLLEIRLAKERTTNAGKRVIIGVAVAAAIIVAAVLTIGSSPASQSIKARVRSFVAEGFTGAGRTLLWRDSVTMVPRYALLGCGPEGFRKAFLKYKSIELAKYAPQNNNESSHNSYLDAAISFGLAGAIFYVAIIGSAFWLLVNLRLRVWDQRWRLIISGLVSSLAAVVVHNFFIYDQIPTGLYFFALMAVAPIISNIAAARREEKHSQPARRESETGESAWAVAIAGCLLLLVTLWYTVSMTGSDIAIKRAFASAYKHDLDSLVANGSQAARAPDPTGAYNFLFARCLAIYVDVTRRSNSTATDPDGDRAKAIEMGIEQARIAGAHTLSPESNNVLLAYLALAAGDTARLREFAGEAVRWDPYFFNARWLMAEALLAEGDREGAIREAEAAIDLGASSSRARSVLARARGESVLSKRKLDSLMNRARDKEKRGRPDKARLMMTRAIRRSRGPCPVCHRELALLFERTGRNTDAIAEWQEFRRDDPQKAAEEQVESRIARLKQR